MKKIRAVFIRHGFSIYNDACRVAGRVDVELSKIGIERLEEISKKNLYPKTNLYFCTPLKRTVQTANILFKDEKDLIEMPEFMELDFGDMDGQPYDRIIISKFFRDWYDGLDSDNVELYSDFEKRINDGIKKIIKETIQRKKNSFTLICHSCVLRNIFNFFHPMEKEEFLKFRTANGYGFIIDINYDEDKEEIKAVNIERVSEENISAMTTEARNENSNNMDELNSFELAKLINSEDKKVAFAVEKELENIAKLAELSTEALKNGGRIIYIGAGTSGRLGVVDASECPPTFSTPPEQVIGLIAGGDTAMFKAVEHAEDSDTLPVEDLKKIDFNKNDILIGIAASGRTPYVIYGLQYAKNVVGAKTGCIVCNKGSVVAQNADVAVEVVVGPEVLTGSTRMKSGTAQKMVLNMVSTISMINIGKTYKNYMVDLCQSNEKLERRALNMVMEIAECDEKVAKEYLEKADGSVKLAITALLGGIEVDEARTRLEKCGGKVRLAIEK